jgi:twitching motility protein PilT
VDDLSGANPLLDDDDEQSYGGELPSSEAVAPGGGGTLPPLDFAKLSSGRVSAPVYHTSTDDDVSRLMERTHGREDEFTSSDEMMDALTRNGGELSWHEAEAHRKEVEAEENRRELAQQEEERRLASALPLGLSDLEMSHDDPMSALDALLSGSSPDDEDDDFTPIEADSSQRKASAEDAIPLRKKQERAFSSFEDDDEDEMAGFNLDEVLATAIDVGASDVHLNADDYVAFTVLGDIQRRAEFNMVTPYIVDRLRLTIISHVLEADFIKRLELDTSYVIRTGRHAGRRTRLSVGKGLGSVMLTFRVIADVIPTPEQLGVTGELLKWSNLPSGLVLVCGPTGTGKSTTFASLVRKIQLERPVKIITIEKPVEYIYGTDGVGLVVQREVGLDARTFSGALDSAMRQAPDVVMVGEARNQEEIEAVVRAAESGHLVFSTLHSSSPSATVNRISSMFTGEDKVRVLGSLEDNLRGMVNQVLVKRKDGNGRVAIREVVYVNAEVASLIGQGDSRGIRDYQLRTGTTMDHELVKAVKSGLCTAEEARMKSAYPNLFDELIAK